MLITKRWLSVIVSLCALLVGAQRLDTDRCRPENCRSREKGTRGGLVYHDELGNQQGRRRSVSEEISVYQFESVSQLPSGR